MTKTACNIAGTLLGLAILATLCLLGVLPCWPT